MPLKPDISSVSISTAERASSGEPAPSLLPVAILPPDWSNRRIFSLMWPLVVEQLLSVTMGVADTVMVSSVGEFAVSGVSIVDTINFLLITTFTALATGGAVVTSQYIGRGDRGNTSSSARQLIYVSLFTSVIMMIFALITHNSILRIIYGNIEPDVSRAARIYFIITALSYPFLALYSAASALFRSMGNSRITMLVALLVNIINVAGNALFIYGMDMGVGGAALSTLIGRFIAAFILLYTLIRGKKKIIDLSRITRLTIDTAMLKRILNIGIPSGLEASMFQVGKILIMRIFTFFGTTAIAANAVTATINSLGFMPGNAFGMGLLIIAGQCIGAKDYNGARRYTKKIIIFSYLFYFIVNINVMIFKNPIIGIFHLSPDAYKLCASFINVHCITSTLFWCMSFVVPSALKAAGDARYVMIVAASTMWIVRVSAAFI
ncbi:MAG: MATE family efflux transporter, partial [Treponema sp.]|nr:MATE family efflux transporter [Treponema sp.]